MFYNKIMPELISKLGLLSEYSYLEPDTESQSNRVSGCSRLRHSLNNFIPEVSHATLPNGKQIRVLKTLLSSACEKNCNYCAFRAGRDFQRESLTPDELSKVFIQMTVGGIVDGLFLSSGVAGGGMRTQDQLIASAEILREKYQYKGYIHLKLMPGAEKDQIERAMQLADRVSINLEAPNPSRLNDLAPKKEFNTELLQPLKWAEHIRNTKPAYLGWNNHWPSLCTQFVVGGTQENDLELIQTSTYLFSQLHLKRIYYSGFSPIPDTPLENNPPENPLREHRLYQVSFLLRDYGFEMEDIPFTSTGFLPLDQDPKQIWAKENLSHAPVEINRANRLQLLRIPGIGPRGAEAILQSRNANPLETLGDLRRLGINFQRAAPYILLNGKSPDYQMRLW